MQHSRHALSTRRHRRHGQRRGTLERVKRTFLVGLAFASGLGCNDTGSIHRVSPPNQAEEEAPLEVDESAAASMEPGLRPLDDLDDLDRSELEVACFEGSQAACDRLGH